MGSQALQSPKAAYKDEVLVKLPLSHVLSADFCQCWTRRVEPQTGAMIMVVMAMLAVMVKVMTVVSGMSIEFRAL